MSFLEGKRAIFFMDSMYGTVQKGAIRMSCTLLVDTAWVEGYRKRLIEWMQFYEGKLRFYGMRRSQVRSLGRIKGNVNENVLVIFIHIWNIPSFLLKEST